MNFKILIADDDYINRRLLISLLRDTLYQIEVFEVTNGYDALTVCEEEEIQLILLDIEMPKMDGAEFIRYYKEKNLPDIPIIIVSSNDLRTKELLEEGADIFILKPITKDKINSAIQRVLSH